LSSFENTESHGELIKLILRQLITWTPPKEGITLLNLFGGIGIGFEALFITTLLLEEWEDEIHTLKMGTWESIEIFKTSEFNCRGQNTLH
jgi:hypothetical protein